MTAKQRRLAERKAAYHAELNNSQGELIKRRVARREKEARCRRATPGHVYFVAAENGPVKIGWSVDVARRVKGLQTGNPDELGVYGTLPGPVDREREIHVELAAYCVRGEWYQRKAALAYLRAAADAEPKRTKLATPVRDRRDEYGKLTLNQEEAAVECGISLPFFRAQVLPELKVIRIGRRTLIPISEVERWVEERAVPL